MIAGRAWKTVLPAAGERLAGCVAAGAAGAVPACCISICCKALGAPMIAACLAIVALAGTAAVGAGFCGCSGQAIATSAATLVQTKTMRHAPLFSGEFHGSALGKAR